MGLDGLKKSGNVAGGGTGRCGELINFSGLSDLSSLDMFQRGRWMVLRLRGFERRFDGDGEF